MSRYTPRGAAWEAQRRRVLDRDGWTCSVCGKALEGRDATVDHIDPVSRAENAEYGDDELVAMCRTCNSRKGDRTLVRVAYYAPKWLERL